MAQGWFDDDPDYNSGDWGVGMTGTDAITFDASVRRSRAQLPPADAHDLAVELIRERVEDADAEGIVVNLSGGVDSSTTVALAAEAVGPANVLGLSLPTNASSRTNMEDARAVAGNLGIEHETIQLQPLLDMFEDTIAPRLSVDGSRRAVGNVAARFRMAIAYYVANATSRLVVGTSNRTERLLGYYTKYGDGGADLYPLGDLYKTEVRALARDLDLPRRIIDKPPTAGLWLGQTDEGELGAPYGFLDPVLRQLVDTDRDVRSVAHALELERSTVRQYADHVTQSAHKRSLPPILPRRTIRGRDRSEIPSSEKTPAFLTAWTGLPSLRDTVTTFIREQVMDTGAQGVVVNLSGGLDSSLAATLAVKAVGPDRVHGLTLPKSKATESLTFDAGSLAADLEIDHTELHLAPLVSLAEALLPAELTGEADTRAVGNLVARLRMICAYYVANTSSRLVLGTTNRTEWLLGFFTKYGDGGVDLQPLAGLYKTELRALAQFLDLPEAIVQKPPTAGEHACQIDAADLGLLYGTLDSVLWHLVDADASIDATASQLGLDPETVRLYATWCQQTQHKRRVPPTPMSTTTDEPYQYFHELELNFT